MIEAAILLITMVLQTVIGYGHLNDGVLPDTIVRMPLVRYKIPKSGTNSKTETLNTKKELPNYLTTLFNYMAIYYLLSH